LLKLASIQRKFQRGGVNMAVALPVFYSSAWTQREKEKGYRFWDMATLVKGNRGKKTENL
jgi:hypothetical protein